MKKTIELIERALRELPEGQGGRIGAARTQLGAAVSNVRGELEELERAARLEAEALDKRVAEATALLAEVEKKTTEQPHAKVAKDAKKTLLAEAEGT